MEAPERIMCGRFGELPVYYIREDLHDQEVERLRLALEKAEHYMRWSKPIGGESCKGRVTATQAAEWYAEAVEAAEDAAYLERDGVLLPKQVGEWREFVPSPENPVREGDKRVIDSWDGQFLSDIINADDPAIGADYSSSRITWSRFHPATTTSYESTPPNTTSASPSTN